MTDALPYGDRVGRRYLNCAEADTNIGQDELRVVLPKPGTLVPCWGGKGLPTELSRNSSELVDRRPLPRQDVNIADRKLDAPEQRGRCADQPNLVGSVLQVRQQPIESLKHLLAREVSVIHRAQIARSGSL